MKYGRQATYNLNIRMLVNMRELSTLTTSNRACNVERATATITESYHETTQALHRIGSTPLSYPATDKTKYPEKNREFDSA